MSHEKVLYWATMKNQQSLTKSFWERKKKCYFWLISHRGHSFIWLENWKKKQIFISFVSFSFFFFSTLVVRCLSVIIQIIQLKRIVTNRLNSYYRLEVPSSFDNSFWKNLINFIFRTRKEKKNSNAKKTDFFLLQSESWRIVQW